jgi:hypothetical protein
VSDPINVVHTSAALSEGIEEVRFDQGLWDTVHEAIECASWHGHNGWVDGYGDDFTQAVLFALSKKYEMTPR